MKQPRILMIVWGLLIGLAGGCVERVEDRVLHRSSCRVCHEPLNAAGAPEGIGDPHPWFALSCVECHGGQPWVCDGRADLSGAEPACDGQWVYDQRQAHADPAGAPASLRGLSAGELDRVDTGWLRFVNPSDLRVVTESCGRCHTAAAAAVRRSAHGLAAGELAAPRYRASSQPDSLPRFGIRAMVDPNPGPGGACAKQSVARFEPLPLLPGSDNPLNQPTVANALDHILGKACMGCHLLDFGPHDASVDGIVSSQGRFRSSGCSACHMPYAHDGRSVGGDPWVDKSAPGHPLNHVMTGAPADGACMACHYDGARVGLSFRGWRDPAGSGWDPPAVGVVDEAWFGHEAGHYIHDEDVTNDFDETPADVHFEAGMGCIDCHGRAEVHGDGHIYAEAACNVRVRCEDCHGDITRRGGPTSRLIGLFRDDADGGRLKLRLKGSGVVLEVPQVVESIDPASPRFNAAAQAAKGPNAQGFSHNDVLSCTTCHSAWIPTCYGCHGELDLSESSVMQSTGITTPGVPHLGGWGSQTQDLVLMRRGDGKYAPSMPAERLFVSVYGDGGVGVGGAPEAIYRLRPRSFRGTQGEAVAGFGQRLIDPHTTRRRSAFTACDRCHSVGSVEAPDNRVLMDLTHGFGTERFVVRACGPGSRLGDELKSCAPEEQVDYRLDAVMERDGGLLVVPGPRLPAAARPLSLDEIDAMRRVVVAPGDGLMTPTPRDASTNHRWPAALNLQTEL